MLKSLVSTNEVVSKSLSLLKTKNIIIINNNDRKTEQILNSFIMFE